MGILEINNVGIRFGGLQALGDVNLSIKENSVHAIIGPNGAGKSTLLNCLVGKLIPDTGSVMFDGEADGVGLQRSLQDQGFDSLPRPGRSPYPSPQAYLDRGRLHQGRGGERRTGGARCPVAGRTGAGFDSPPPP